MKTDKEVKAEFRLLASKEPEKHYPVRILKQEGFHRNKCSSCGKYFWNINADAKHCGDPACSGGYKFVGNSPAKKQFDYIGAWEAFRGFFKKLGYYEYKRYPVVARWRPDVYWVGASVYPFQPFVVKGEIKPKSNAAIIPQLSLRFNDIDNVGITGSHYVCFDMFGQLHFEKKENYKPNDYWFEYFSWITKGMGVPKEELVVHEDAWAGGGTFGPCMEFFSRGMEIGNQVYMQYEVLENGYKELDIKVLDMGQGHERVPWFTTGKSTSYETTFPTVAKYLYSETGIKVDEKLMQKFLPYSALLNVDEVDDVEKVWKDIAKKTGYPEKELKEKVIPLAALYSIGEHSRACLVALNDGALPSNVGGGYNLRVILRRALGFIEQYNWNIELPKLAEMHAKFLKPMYPELSEQLDDVSAILENEKKKFIEGRKRNASIISKTIEKPVTAETLIQLYDSHGVNPEQVAKAAAVSGKKVVVPDNFYSLVAERHEQQEQATATRKQSNLDLQGIPDTKILYYNDWSTAEFRGKILKLIGNLVVLDQTAFYPTSGGQLHDLGTLGGREVVDIFKQDSVVVHELKDAGGLKAGQELIGKIDFARRKQLMQHHSGVHLLNLCARKVLGPHVYQAGAAKTLDKARLDITHYELLSDDEIKKIQACADELIAKNIPIKKEFLPREVAEDRYGMRIYQGGFIPGKNLRIVTLGEDVEACGGTHANSTADIGHITLLGSTKVQDGIIRLEIVAGNAKEKLTSEKKGVLEEAAALLGVEKSVVPARAKELFDKWKKAGKVAKKGQKIDAKEAALVSKEKSAGTDEELLRKAAQILSTQPEHVPKTISRFLKELNESVKK